jgi:hypothetical protein
MARHARNKRKTQFSGLPVDSSPQCYARMDIPRPEKLLVAMYQLANGTSLPLEYEDIVVKTPRQQFKIPLRLKQFAASLFRLRLSSLSTL